MAEDKLERQIADIGTRYLKRTLGELEQLRACLEQVRSGDRDAMKALAQLAHRIHGSGAMFGFEALSARADTIERLAVADRTGDGDVLQRLHAGIDALEEEVVRQSRLRAID